MVGSSAVMLRTIGPRDGAVLFFVAAAVFAAARFRRAPGTVRILGLCLCLAVCVDLILVDKRYVRVRDLSPIFSRDAIIDAVKSEEMPTRTANYLFVPGKLQPLSLKFSVHGIELLICCLNGHVRGLRGISQSLRQPACRILAVRGLPVRHRAGTSVPGHPEASVAGSDDKVRGLALGKDVSRAGPRAFRLVPGSELPAEGARVSLGGGETWRRTKALRP